MGGACGRALAWSIPAGSADVEVKAPKMNNSDQKDGEDLKSRVDRRKKVGKRKNEKLSVWRNFSNTSQGE